MTLARLKSVAGVTIPDTTLCNAAVDLLESSSPKFLCTHCLRTYIFGSLAVRSLGRPVADEEAAFLHDLGLIPPYGRDNRFEIDGVEAAGDFCAKHQVSPERADLVWSDKSQVCSILTLALPPASASTFLKGQGSHAKFLAASVLRPMKSTGCLSTPSSSLRKDDFSCRRSMSKSKICE